MREEVKHIYHLFGGKLVGSKFMKLQVCETMAKMPREVIVHITQTCWFVSSMDDAWAFTFTGNDLKHQHLIFLSDDLLSQNVEQIQHSIAHEIGHVVLGHRNSVLARQSKAEIRSQEKEADAFVAQFLG